jgi:hypothetical protein
MTNVGDARQRQPIGSRQLADAARQPQHEDQDFRHRLVEFGRNFVAEFDSAPASTSFSSIGMPCSLATSMIFSPMVPLPLATTRGAPVRS